MRPEPQLLLDPRRARELRDLLLSRRAAYLPGWEPPEGEAEDALLWVAARYLEAILQRLNQAPEKNRLAFLDLLGVRLTPAQAARAPIVFQVAEDAPPLTRAPAGTQLSAEPPPESTTRVVFETETGVGFTRGRLQQVVSLWAGRDQYADHSAALAAGEPFQPFFKRELQDTPHHIYIAHNPLLAIAGEAEVSLTFELTQTSSEHLRIAWEYWDGEVWRGFKSAGAGCEDAGGEVLDSTQGLTQSGRFLLQSDCAEAKTTTVNGVENFWIRGRLLEPLPPDPAQILPLVESIALSTEIARPLLAELDEDVEERPVAARRLPLWTAMRVGEFPTPQLNPCAVGIKVEGIEPDVAYAGAEKLDTSQTFFPFGQAVQPGSAFYFSNEEIFSKPGAEVTVYVQCAQTPYNALSPPTTGSANLTPDVVWEYWDGNRWRTLVLRSEGGVLGGVPEEFTGAGVFQFTVPDDMEPKEVNGEELRWVRARLRSGGYGYRATVNIDGSEFSYVVTQPPALAVFLLGYTWQHGPYHPDTVFAYNDFQYTDHTAEARWPGQVFSPFTLVSDVTPALYLGFTQPLPVDRFNLFVDVEEVRGESEGPPLLWEYWDGFNWRSLPVEDETNHLRVPGMVSLIGPADAQPVARFGEMLHWLRARLKEDGPPGSPTIRAIYPNAVWAAQRQTLINEPLGTSTGRPSQTFRFRQVPVLPGEHIEVRELSGPRANVEWRLLAMEVLGDDYAIIQQLEDELRREGTQAEVVMGDLRLERDRNKQVTAVWVRWYGQDHLFFSGPDDRHYLLERSRGQVLFGDGVQGRVPPAGAVIMARQYVSGGGAAGNVKAGAITQLLAGIGGIDGVTNPRPAEGGADGESLAGLSRRGPLTLRHRGRALSPADYEVMAVEASPAVAVARALPTVDDGGRVRPGWLTLVIIPASDAPRPWPSYGLREHVRRTIAERAPADLVAAEQIVVTGPDYQEVDVDALIVPSAPGEAGAIEQRVRERLMRFFHPLHGGPTGRGWEPGRAVYLSDVAAVIERVEGVDVVQELALMSNGVLQGERLRIGPGRIAVAGQIRLRLAAAEQRSL